MGRSVDKYPAGDLFPNIVIHNTLFICGRVADWENRDPKQVLRLHCLVSSRVVLICGSLHDVGQVMGLRKHGDY